MKIQCDVCEAAEAEVVCCADEAALCSGCDLKVHTGKKIVNKHQRLPLYASAMPKCDVCQEALGWFFCLEDRAVLCRKCDIATHKGSPRQFSHQRLLLTGIQVGLGATITPQSSHTINVSESQGSEQWVSEWSRILKSVDEGALNNNLGEPDDISWTVPRSLSAHPDPNIHAISPNTMETEFNKFQHQQQRNLISRKRRRDELSRRET